MKKVLVINGPNLDMLGMRKKEVYGSRTYADLVDFISNFAKKLNVNVEFYQTYDEGEIAKIIAHASIEEMNGEKVDGILINAGAYSHYSIAIRDAIEANERIKVASVHISDIEKRESFRHIDLLKDVVDVYVKGLGFDSYTVALEKLAKLI